MKNLGTLGYGLIFDNLKCYSIEKTRWLLNKFALLYEGLPVSDSWILTNGSLKAIIQGRAGGELLRNGIIIPARRDTAGSILELLQKEQAKETPMHGIVATPDYAALVDKETPESLIFKLKDVGQAYKTLSTRMLEIDVLLTLKISEHSAILARKIIDEGRDSGKDIHTNTFIKDIVCAQLLPQDQALFMEIFRAAYELNLPNYFSTGVVGPEGYRGDEMLSVIKSSQHDVGTVDVQRNIEEVQGFVSETDNPFVCWLFSDGVLANLTVEELVIARSTSNRQEYLSALSRQLAEPNSENWERWVSCFLRYYEEAGKEVFDYQRKTNTVSSEPGLDFVINVKGGRNIVIQAMNEKPVMMSGVQETSAMTKTIEVDPVKILSKTIAIPKTEMLETSQV
jgi:hypothetical protein